MQDNGVSAAVWWTAQSVTISEDKVTSVCHVHPPGEPKLREACIVLGIDPQSLLLKRQSGWAQLGRTEPGGKTVEESRIITTNFSNLRGNLTWPEFDSVDVRDHQTQIVFGKKYEWLFVERSMSGFQAELTPLPITCPCENKSQICNLAQKNQSATCWKFYYLSTLVLPWHKN